MLKSIIKTETLLAPGIYDALSGLIAEQSGAQAVYLSGASIALSLKHNSEPTRPN